MFTTNIILFLTWVMLALVDSQEEIIDCDGLECENGGILTFENNTCFCTCTQNTSGSYCEFQIYESEFPPGPYALPMSNEGCAEEQSHGWDTGYINLTTSSPFNKTSYLETCTGRVEEMHYFYNVPNSSLNTNILGPFDKYTLQLNFCFKSADHPSKQRGAWPQGHYGVFGADDGCPDGFIGSDMKICLPPLLHYNAEGFLPYFNLEERQQFTALYLLYCGRIQQEVNDMNGISVEISQPFLVIKDPARIDRCPVIQMYDVKEEAFPIALHTTFTELNISYILSYCRIAFQEDSDSHDNSSIQLPCESHSFVDVRIHVPNCGQHLLSYQLSNCENVETWVMIDARERLLVSGVLFTTYTTSIHGEHSDLFGGDADVGKIYVGDKKWSFLNHGAKVCRHTTVTSGKLIKWFSNIGQELFTCHRSVTGRYVTFVITSTRIFAEVGIFDDTLISFLTEESVKGSSSMSCLQDLGMQNYDIQDFQLSASSWQNSSWPTGARPNGSGWCSGHDDQDPYIELDLLQIMTVDGVIMFNWYDEIDEIQNHTYVRKTRMRGSSGIYLETGRSLLHMKRHNSFKPVQPLANFFNLTPSCNMQLALQEFKWDQSRRADEPQTFLLSKPVVARYIRILPKPVEKDSVCCLRFELLGCRKSEISGMMTTKTKVDNNLDITFDVVTIDIGEVGPFTSIGYPHVYAYNAYYLWNITLPDRVPFLQFTDISLRTYEDPSALTNMRCRDTIIVTGYDIEDPYIFLKSYYGDFSFKPSANQREFLTSDFNGKMPAYFSMRSKGEPMYVALLSCSPTHIKQPGSGFRVHVTGTGYPNCLILSSAYGAEYCQEQVMQLITPNFLGRHDVDYHYFRFYISPSNTALLVAIQILDFDISCFSDSYFVVVNMAASQLYCNMNVTTHEELYFLSQGLFLYYSMYKLPTSEAQVFPEGFHLIYRTLPRNETFPYHVVATEGTVCVGELNKCFIFQRIKYKSWIDAGKMCQQNKTSLVSIKSDKEFHFLRLLLLDLFRKRTYYGYGHAIEMYIGLSRYIDSFGASHEHWIDGTPLTFSAWAENQPSETFLKQCTKLKLLVNKPKQNNIWETTPCSEVPDVPEGYKTELICEQIISVSDDQHTGPAISCFNGTASMYRGHQSTTRYGLICQRWDTQYPNAHTFIDNSKFPDKTIADAANYCRSPDDDLKPWCFVNDSMIVWDYCLVERCQSTEEIITLAKDKATLYQCSSGEWMADKVLCNGVEECSDSSDELNCSSISETCGDDFFMCNDGRCIQVSLLCDFVKDCDDGSDEFCEHPACDFETEFSCSNGQCIPLHQRCDSFKQCTDGSDETFCEQCNEEVAFQCGDTSCISKRLVCDGHVDCLDGADERACNKLYSTCDDIWRDGLTKDGIYTLDEGFRVHCHFNRSTGFLTMKFLNSDRKRYMNAGMYLVHPPSTSLINEATSHGYLCSQVYAELPKRDKERAMLLDNVFPNETDSSGGIKHKVYLNMHRWGHQKNFQLLYITRPGELGTIKLSMFESFKKENRLSVDGAECIKGLQNWHETIFCHKGIKSKKQKQWCFDGTGIYFRPFICEEVGVYCRANGWNEKIFCQQGKPIDQNLRCIYDTDENDRLLGCRSYDHLQNCENISCPAHHFKCPNSYCVPVMFVCNGQADCPDGEDEQVCDCQHTEPNAIRILFPSSDIVSAQRSRMLQETASKLGGALFTRKSSVKILKVKKNQDQNGYPFVLEGSAILSKSKHTGKLYEVYNMNQTHGINNVSGLIDLLFENSSYITKKTLVWLTDDLTTTDAETHLFINVLVTEASEQVYKFRIMINAYPEKELNLRERSNFTEMLIRDQNILSTLGSSLFPSLCKGKPVDCAGKYRCRLSMVCIPLTQLCDGRKHCPFGDDEESCDFDCPRQCACRPLIVNCSNLTYNNETFFNISSSTRILDVSYTKELGKAVLSDKNQLYYLPLLVTLIASNCEIQRLTLFSFRFLKNLFTLDISFNKITKLARDTFLFLRHLKTLKLDGNYLLSVIEPGAFNGLSNISIAINYANIKVLTKHTFTGIKLTQLDLSNNKIESVEDYAFESLSCQTLDIRNNPIKVFSSHIFDGIEGLKRLITPQYKFCCRRPAYLIEENCLPYKDEFSSCKHLMRNTSLQTLMWIIGLLALFGNILSVAYRLLYDKKRLKLGYGIFVTNLAVADLLMGIYMLIIAIADKIYMDRYIEVDEYWRNSVWCKIAGYLSTTSSEASVLLICLITFDRLLVIKFPFGQMRFKTKSALFAVLICWVVSFAIAAFPLMHTGYFKGKFYSTSGVCLALPLTRDRPPGWLYSMFIFVGFNLVTFTLIAAGQLFIYLEIREQSRKRIQMRTTRANDLKVARNLLLVVTTDFMCWFPVGVMGVLATLGHVIPGEMYAWTAVLILPINSALNPFMYTFSAIVGKKKFVPNIEEQNTKTETLKDIGQAVVNILPYFSSNKNDEHGTTQTLRQLLKRRILSLSECAYVIHEIANYVTLLHGDGLVLDHIHEDNVMLRVTNRLKIRKKVQVCENPSLSSKKVDQAEDVYNIGRIAEKLLQETRQC